MAGLNHHRSLLLSLWRKDKKEELREERGLCMVGVLRIG